MDDKTIEPNTNSGKIEEKIRDEHGRLLPGVVLNPKGRPKGSRNFYNDFREAIKRIKDETTGEPITEQDIIYIGMKKMLKGDARFEDLYKDTMNRVYGMATQTIDHTTGGDKIESVSPELMALAKKYEEELLEKMK